MALLDKLKQQMQAPAQQPANIGGQTDTVRGLLQAKTGKAAAPSAAPQPADEPGDAVAADRRQSAHPHPAYRMERCRADGRGRSVRWHHGRHRLLLRAQLPPRQPGARDSRRGRLLRPHRRRSALVRRQLQNDATGALVVNGSEPERRVKDITARAMSDQFAVNCIGPSLVLKHGVRLLPRKGSQKSRLCLSEKTIV